MLDRENNVLRFERRKGKIEESEGRKQKF